MKKYNYLLAGVLVIYLGIAGLLLYLYSNVEKDNGREYRVAIHRILLRMQEEEGYKEPDLKSYPLIEQVSFLSREKMESEREGEEFFSRETRNITIEPLYVSGELLGYVKFTYREKDTAKWMLILTELILFFAVAVMFSLFCYLKIAVLRPFVTISELPYEMSKGHLNGEVKESKSRYFGKFIWGLSMLQDHLNAHKRKELELEREKKMLLLSISHDIKTPLNTIRLYARAIAEGVYQEEDACQMAAGKIGQHTEEIEAFVKEIMKNSSEEILQIEVEKGEFYLKDLTAKLESTYREKCRLKKTALEIEPFENRLVKGDFDRSFEVLENLMENAFKYGDGKLIQISFYEEDYCQLIRVFNTGLQVEESEFTHLFDSFYRGSNTEGRTGNGLGLHICREIMHKMEGEIFAERQKEGMRFTMVLELCM